MAKINHVWFDLDGTITVQTPAFHEAHDNLRYETYAEIVKKPVTPELKEEFEELYRRSGSNSAAFTSLGVPSGYWMERFNKLIDTGNFYEPDERVYGTLEKLKDIVPISLFTNNSPTGIAHSLSSVGVNQAWFTYVLSGDDIAERKPALEGFHKMIAKTGIPADELLYVGDRIKVDIAPAKAVGAQTCLVWSESNEADYSAPNFTELLTIVR